MFWKKGKVAIANATTGPAPATTTSGIEVLVTEAAASKPTVKKLPGPGNLPEAVGRDIVVKLKKDPDWVWNQLKAVLRPDAVKNKQFDVRVFSDNAASKANVKVKDFNTFDEHPELILFEGKFDKVTGATQLTERKAA